MSEQRLNQPNVRPALKQMGREAAAKRVHAAEIQAQVIAGTLLDGSS
jgi:hypothetical protein